MAITFERAPLLEVITELKWGAASVLPQTLLQGQSFNIDLETTSKSEDFFMHFGAECSRLGLQRAERIVPHGFPLLPGNVVYRFRSGSSEHNSLLQVGPGVFTANGVPPNYSWDGYRSFLDLGLQALLLSRSEAEAGVPFTYSLRFLNGFGSDFRKGNSKLGFLKTLGFTANLPNKLAEVAKDSHDAALTMRFSTNTSDGGSVFVSITDGAKDGGLIQVIELGLTYSKVAASRDEVLKVTDASHALIEQIFLDMTQEYHGIMKMREV
jgi:hypothetical protein